MKHILLRSLTAASAVVLVGISALASTYAEDRPVTDNQTNPPPPTMGTGSHTDMPRPPRPPMMNGSGATGSGIMMPPPREGSGSMMPPRDGSGAMMGSGNMIRPMPPVSGSGTSCQATGFTGAWRGSLSLKAREGGDYEYEGEFRLMDVGGDGTQGTEDDIVYEGTFYASETEDGNIEMVATAEDGTTSDYATLEFVSDNELEGTISLDGREINAKSARECGKPRNTRENRAPNNSTTGSGGMSMQSGDNSVRMGRDGMEVRSEDGSTVRMDNNGMSVESRSAQKSLLSEALKSKIDERLAKMDADTRHALYKKVIDKVDTLVAAMPDGKKKGLYIELGDYLETKWYEEFPEDWQTSEDSVLDEFFSE